MRFSTAVILGLASNAVAQYSPYQGAPSSSSSSSGLAGPTAASTSIPLATGPPSSGSKTIITYLSCTDTSSVGGTVTDIITSAYCDKCDHNGAFTTVFLYTGVDVCPTGLTTPVYTVTATITGNPESYTPATTVPPEFTVYETVCTACDYPEQIVTVTVPCPTNSGLPTQAPLYTSIPASSPYNKPAGTAYSTPPAPPASTGPAMVTVSGASMVGSPVWFFTIVVGIMGAVFAGLIMV